MEGSMFSNGGTVPKVADTHVVALYHPVSGKILHMHSVTVFEGGRAVSQEEAIETAKKLASKTGLKIAGLEVKLSKDLNHARKPHRIDVKSGEFVAVPMVKRAKAAATNKS